MSEPLKKPDQTPESYQPKEVPVIMKLAQQAQSKEEGDDNAQSSSSSGGSGMLPNIRAMFDGMKGQNYKLPDCLLFLWECLHEAAQPDYWDFAAAIGDSAAMVYNRNLTTIDEYCVSGYLAGPDYFAYVFDALGRGHSYVTAAQVNADKEKYLRQVKDSIDRGLPVLVWTTLAARQRKDVPGWADYSVIVGYEGQTLTLNVGNQDGGAFLHKYDASGEIGMDLIFVGEKQREITLEALYLRAIKMMPHWLALPECNGMLFGAAAFRAWADDIEGGRYDDKNINLWENYGAYVCNLATSPGVPSFIFQKLAAMDPAYARYMALYDEIIKIFPACMPDDSVPKGTGKDGLWSELERLGGGLFVKHKAFRSKTRCRKIAAALRTYAGRLDEAVRILTPEGYTPKEVPSIIAMARQTHDAVEGPDAPASSSSGGGEMLPNIRGICDGMKGHNYALPDCLAFLWERLDESPALDFWRFAALTGDTVAQVYNRKPSTRCEYCVSGYLAGPEHIAYVFDALGYSHEYVTAAQINADKNEYLRQLISHIDRGVPVLVRFHMADIPGWDSDVGTYSLVVGYAREGNTLLLNFGCLNEDGEARLLEYDASGEIRMDWIFVGEKLREITPEEIYLRAINMMSHWLTLPERDGMFFGAAAFRAWADDIESGRYEDESVDLWDNYGVYVCNLATSGGEPTYLFRQLAELNPQYAGYIELGETIQRLLPAETPTGGKTLDWIRLDELKGGLDAERKVLCDKKKRGKIAAVLRERADRLDEAVRILSPEGYQPKETPAIISMAQQTQIQSQEEPAMQHPEIITRKFLLAGFEAAIELNDAHWPGMDYVKAALKENLHKLGNLAQPPRFFDVWEADPNVNYQKKKNHSRRLFFFGAEVTSLDGIPEGFVTKDFPETTWALSKEREHGHAKFEALAAAGYKLDGAYAEKYAMDMEIYGDIEDEGPQWDALIPGEKR